ncbi:MAG: hypothetical protein Q8T09_16200 [Candidatus Melainabacteria bacterium]|nr:hypothetical protein [Candidatus Melainabacteria bacterium]
MSDTDGPQEATKLKAEADSGFQISEAYNSLDEDQRKAVFKEMTSSSNTNSSLTDLIITGIDTDGDRQPDELKDILDPATGKDLYNRPGEGDHSDEAWKTRWKPIISRDSEFRAHFKEYISGGGAYEAPIGGLDPSAIRRDALKGMIEKHGLDRLKETFEGLEEIGGSKGFYSHSLHAGFGAGREDIERNMSYIDRLMEPGKIEAAKKLGRILEDEGFSKNPSLEELANPEFVKMLTEDEQERSAYKEINNAPMGPMIGFFDQNRDNLDGLKPSEQLAMYKEYEQKWMQEREEEARPYKEEVEQHGKPPVEVLTEAMQHNDVLMIGEKHLEKSPHREGMTPLIEELKKSGATHFVVEMEPAQLEAYLNDNNMEHLPAGLRHQDYVDLLKKVQDEGLNIVAANSSGTEQERDNHMASTVSDILELDPKNKVVFWVGQMHGADTSSGANLSTANLLRDKGVTVATVMEQSPSASGFDSLTRYAKVDKPTAIKTKDSPKISELEFTVIGNDIEEKYGLWDIVILYPKE